MDSNLLKVFVSVADNGSISLAAKDLGFAQSNVTARIKQLEKSLDLSLFHRVPKGVILTLDGQKLYPQAKEIVQKVDITLKNMLSSKTQSLLRVGSTDCNAAVRILPFLMRLHEDHPKMQTELYTATTKVVTQMILDYKVDIAFISGEPKTDELVVLKKYEEEIAILEAKDGSSQDVVLSFKEGCAYDEFLKNYYLEKGEKVDKSLAYGSLETILACVKTGLGKTLLPTNIVKKMGFYDDIKITKLDKKTAYIPTCLVCRKDNVPLIEDYLRQLEFDSD